MKNGIIAIIAAMAIMIGCAGMLLGPSVCDDPGAGESWLCSQAAKNGLKIEGVDLFIRIAIARTLTSPNDQYQLARVIDKIEYFLSDNITYRFIMDYVGDELTGPEVELISSQLIMFNSTKLVSDFDKGLILKHISKIRKTLE